MSLIVTTFESVAVLLGIGMLGFAVPCLIFASILAGFDPSAMPVVVERAGGNRNIVNQFMFSSFIVALVSIPVMVFLFEKYFSP